jgi:hypothetical protein
VCHLNVGLESCDVIEGVGCVSTLTASLRYKAGVRCVRLEGPLWVESGTWSVIYLLLRLLFFNVKAATSAVVNVSQSKNTEAIAKTASCSGWPNV